MRGGGKLRNVHGHDKAGGADGCADDGAAEDHDEDAAAEGLAEGADDKEEVCVEDDAFAAEAVGEVGGEGGDEEGEEGGGGGDDGFIEGGEQAVVEGLVYRYECC